jgi:hypothetical protein
MSNKIKKRKKNKNLYKTAEKKRKNILISILVITLIILITFGLFQPFESIGLAVMTHKLNYSDNVSLVIDNDYEYTWLLNNPGKLESVKLDGSISKHGSAKVYLKHDRESYLIFDSLRLDEAASLDDLTIQEDQESNDESTMITSGGGRKNINKVFEFDVNNVFNWDIDYSKLCTKWNINDINICYGAEDCCALINKKSLGNWNDTFYLSYGRYSTDLNNIIKVQVIYADYSLDIEAPYSDIIYSDVEELKAEFYEDISFKDACIETCLLPDFNGTSYELLFIIDEASLRINDIKYSVEESIEVSDNAPELIKNIDNITIYKNEEFKINLSQYFTDKDNNKLTYSVYKTDNLSILIEDSIARMIPNFNFTGKRYSYFTVSDDYYNMTSNAFSITVIEKPLTQEEVNISEEIIKPRVIINRPVRWIKKVNVSESVINLSINISSDALNVSVKNIKENKIISEDNIKVNDRGIVKNASKFRAEKRIEQIEKIETKLEDKKEEITSKTPSAKIEIGSINRELNDLQNEKNKLTGYAIVNKEKGLLTKFIEWFFDTKITGYAVIEEETSNTTSIIIEDIVEEIEIEYYTEGPISEEEDISSGKRIVISSDIHYEDILAYTELNEISQDKIKLYHIINNSRILVEGIIYYDDNNNNLIDYIEWIVPSLSNQTYEIIIEITNAEHLDASKNLIADIYDYVYARDNNWTLVNNGEYIRATFRRALDNTRDITIYAKSNTSSSIEIYTENGNEIITTFENILEEKKYKVYLTNLEENQSYKTFDLKINGNIEFDYIVDPSGTPITNCTGLQDMNNDLSASYYLAKDIDCSNTSNWNSGSGFDPIGDSGTQYSGTFDGQGYTIGGLYISRSMENYVGLFGYTNGATITNLSVVGADITCSGSYYQCGVLAGMTQGTTVSYVMVSGDITGDYNYYVGGLIGQAGSGSSTEYISDCSAIVDVTGYDYVGGLIGYAYGDSGSSPWSVTNCFAMGDVSSYGSMSGTGGLIGYAYYAPHITTSYATGLIYDYSGSGYYFGGLVGHYYDSNMMMSIYDSYARGDVNGYAYVGGLIGYTYYGNIYDSYATGYGYASYDYAGGLIGESYGNVYDSYAVGDSYSNSGMYDGCVVGSNYGYIDIAYYSPNCMLMACAGYDAGTIMTCSAESYDYYFHSYSLAQVYGSGAYWSIYDCASSVYTWCDSYSRSSHSTSDDYPFLSFQYDQPTRMMVTSPINQTYDSGSTIYATIGAFDFGDISYCYAYVDGSSQSMSTTKNVDNQYLELSYTMSGLSDGAHNVYFYCADSYGGGTYSPTTYFELVSSDAVAPVVSVVYPLNTNYSVNVSELNYTVTEDNPDRCWYSRDSGASNSSDVSSGTNFTSVDSVEGDNTWIVYCNDTTGNEGSDSVTFTKDSIAPVVSVVYPLNTNYSVNVSELNYTASDAGGLDRCWYSNNSGVTNSTTVAAGTNFTSVDSVEGDNTWIVYCNDTTGNEESDSVTFTKDTIAPVIDLIYPSNINYNINVSSLNYTITDDNPNYCWWSNGSTNSTPVSAGINWTGLTSIEGSNTWIIYCNDTAGNENSSNVTFIKDITTPTINKVNITPTVGPSGTIFNISINATDNIQIDTVIAYIQKPDENNTFNTTLSLTNGLYNGTWNSSGKANGTYVIDIIANDTSGNQKELENSAVIALSSTAQNTFVNSSVIFIANTSLVINATEETDIWLNITTSANTTASITIAEYSNNIEAVSALGVSELGKYISIIVDNETNNNISYAEIRVYYTDAQLTTANLTESSLRLYKFNTSSNLWYVINPGGVNTNLNYVWGNISRFSSFGIFGSKVTSTFIPPSRTSTSKAKAICTPEWDCTEWSECIDRIQTRTCKIKGTCYNYEEEPETTKECGIERKIGIDLSKTEDEIGFFDIELRAKDNNLDINFAISSKEGNEIENLEIEFNLNQKKSTKLLDYIGPFNIEDQHTIERTYNIEQLKEGEYEINIKLYKEGKKIEEFTDYITIDQEKTEKGEIPSITGNVIMLDRKGIKEESRFIPLALIFIILFSLGIIRDIVKEK